MSTSTPNIGSQPVFSQAAATRYDGGPGDYTSVTHGSSLALKTGTISLAFTIDSTVGRYALISKDLRGNGEGQFTLWVDDGELKLRIENGSKSKTLEAEDMLIQAGQEYQVAFTFGTGASLWVNGGLVAAEPTFDQGLDMNTNDLLIVGSRAWTSASREPHSLFRGEISDVHIYDTELRQADMLALAEHTDPMLDNAARMMVGMEDLAPVFAQLHHGSANLKSILSGYGVSEHGHIMRPVDRKMGDNSANTIDGTAADDAINGKGGDDSINGLSGNDILQGHYGNDTVLGGLGDDILDGGHGEDSLNGGAGNDLLIAQADGREPIIAQDPSYAPHQMIPSNDVLTGGTGADIFYSQTLINARREFIEKHTKDDGTINWHGVAGENNNPHDHWVDYQGNETITDYRRLDGDRIVIEGHTTYVKSLTYGDEDNDGVLDHSVIEIYSQQGKNGGAHDEDALGTIKVFGDLVQLSDIETTAAPAYGIVNDISRLAEALKPISAGSAAAPVAAPTSLAGPSSFAKLDGNAPVFGAAGSFAFTPELDAPLVFDHDSAMALNAGTIAFTFNATNLRDNSFLFSKDAKDNGTGGHISAYVTETGDLKVRLQDASKSEWIVAQGAVQERTDYDFAFSFGPAGAQLFLNGTRVAALTDVKTDLTGNAEKLVVGASNWSSPAGTSERLWGDFDGTISNFAVYGSQVSGTTAPDLSSPGVEMTVAAAMADGAFWMDATGALMLTVGGNDQSVGADVGKVTFSDGSIMVSDIRKATAQDDILHGTTDADVLAGLAGADALNGLGGNDVLLGGNGNDTALGGDGDDNLHGDNEEDFLSGGAGDDTAAGGRGDDTILGDAGADNLMGGVGLDYMNGGAGDDMLSGEADSDTLDGWDGNDTMNGGQGWDLLIGGDGDDSLIGDSENDTLLGGDGNDTLEGGHDDDLLFSEHDDDELWGWLGNDILEGGKGDDTVFGEAGNDIVSGGEGNDSLIGGSENDTLWGFTGDDTLDGGAGDDQLRAEAGNDVYLYFDGFGNDTIYGFEATNDLEDIDLSGVSTVTDYADLSANHMTQDGSDVLIDTGVGTIRLESTNLADLSAADFIL